MLIDNDLAREAYEYSHGLRCVAKAYLRDHGFRDEKESRLLSALYNSWKRLGLKTRRVPDVMVEIVAGILDAEQTDEGDSRSRHGLSLSEITNAANRAVPYINMTHDTVIRALRSMKLDAWQYPRLKTGWHISIPPTVGEGRDVVIHGRYAQEHGRRTIKHTPGE